MTPPRRWAGVVETLCDDGEQFGCAGQIPVGVGHIGVAEVGGQQRQVGLHIDAVAIPTLEGHNSEAVPQVVWAGPTRT